MKNPLSLLFTAALLLLTASSVRAQKWVVYSITGNPQLVGISAQMPLQVFDTLGPQSIINLPEGASMQLIDLENKRMCVIMRREDSKDRISNLIKLSGDNVSELTQNQINYMKTQLLAAEKKKQAEKKKAKKSSSDDELGGDFASEFNAFKEEVEKEYEDFRASVNEEYAKFMKEGWKGFKREKPVTRPKVPEVKPLTLPEKERGKAIESKPINVKVVPPILPTPQPMPISPIEATDPVVEQLVIKRQADDPMHLDPVRQDPLKVKPVNPNVKIDPLNIYPVKFNGITFELYGTRMKVHFDAKQKFQLKSLREADIADTWKQLSSKDYNNTIIDCINLRNLLHLSDWAYILLLEKMAKTALGDTNEATLLMAYVYCQSGYQMRLAKSATRLFMLYSSRHLIYEQGYFTLNGSRFYPFHCEEASLNICNLPFPAEQALSLLVPEEQEFADTQSPARQLTSASRPELTAKCSVNQNLIQFYNDYPTSTIDDNVMTRWAMYANTPLSEGVRQQLYPTLQAKIKGMSQYDAVDALLNWVQLSLTYKYDEEVWGHDRAFFAEETLYYPFADCEDRSILFSRLVRDLLGLKVVLVYYPGHLATAVHFTTDVKGDYLTHNGERFTICDPTFMGASAGRTMSGMDNSTAQAILLK